ncbi:MAG TPA: hypothetical protein DCM57_07735 [Treponema sp.]|nr:hypothetical protein [Treponema sp.]
MTVTRSRDIHRELWKKYNQTVTFWITELLLPGIEQGLWITKVLPLERGLITKLLRSGAWCRAPAEIHWSEEKEKKRGGRMDNRTVTFRLTGL